MLIFVKDSSQMILMLGPLTFVIIEILFITIVINAVDRML